MEDHLALNRAMWDSRAALHAASRAYDVDRYLRDPAAISDVVRFDLPRLGDLAGVRAVHLQCHIGTDTLSLRRLGADVVGLDLSPASLQQARLLVERTGDAVELVESDVHVAADVLGRHGFDLVYTGIGALNWLPSVDRWAGAVAALLRPGGRLVLRESHPMLGALDVVDGRVALAYPYAEQVEPLAFEDTASYVDLDDHSLPGLPSREWTHGLAETLTALMTHGLTIETFLEHDCVPWEALPGHMEPHPDHPGELRLVEHPERLAASFTVVARRPA